MQKEKVIIFLLACINFTHILDFMIMMPLGPQFMRTFKIDAQAFGFLVSSYTFSSFISGLIAAFFVDRFDRKSILLIGYLGFVLGTFACAIAPTFGFLLLARAVAGFFGGVSSAQVMSIVGDLIPFERRGQAMGILTTAFSVASVVGVPFGLYLAAEITWHAPFVLVAIFGFIALPFIWLFIPSMTDHISQADQKPSPAIAYWHLSKDFNQQMGLILLSFLVIGHFMIIPYISPYLVANVGFQERDLTYVYLVGGAFTMFTAPILGKWADRYGKFKVLRILLILSALPIFLITNMPRVPIYWVLVATVMFFVFSGGRFIPSQAILSQIVPPQQRGGYMSIIGSFRDLASGGAALLSGFIISENAQKELINYQYVGYLAIILSLVAILIAQNLKTIDQPQEAVVK
jgi:predicted MFS family arabinose efflux permease